MTDAVPLAKLVSIIDGAIASSEREQTVAISLRLFSALGHVALLARAEKDAGRTMNEDALDAALWQLDAALDP